MKVGLSKMKLLLITLGAVALAIGVGVTINAFRYSRPSVTTVEGAKVGLEKRLSVILGDHDELTIPAIPGDYTGADVLGLNRKYLI
jgi:hypothetical protein